MKQILVLLGVVLLLLGWALSSSDVSRQRETLRNEKNIREYHRVGNTRFYVVRKDNGEVWLHQLNQTSNIIVEKQRILTKKRR